MVVVASQGGAHVSNIIVLFSSRLLLPLRLRGMRVAEEGCLPCLAARRLRGAPVPFADFGARAARAAGAP